MGRLTPPHTALNAPRPGAVQTVAGLKACKAAVSAALTQETLT